MKHQSGRVKLNLKGSHKKSLVRNQIIHMIEHGSLTSTVATIKEVRRHVEKVVTIARTGNNFNARRRVHALVPYKQSAILKLFADIAPRYTTRPGGYTRIIPLGVRVSDQARIARLEWVA